MLRSKRLHLWNVNDLFHHVLNRLLQHLGHFHHFLYNLDLWHFLNNLLKNPMSRDETSKRWSRNNQDCASRDWFRNLDIFRFYPAQVTFVFNLTLKCLMARNQGSQVLELTPCYHPRRKLSSKPVNFQNHCTHSSCTWMSGTSMTCSCTSPGTSNHQVSAGG